jgi:hypothetical protein
MTSDVINSIDDTDEGQQVAQIVKSTFQNMMSSRNWPHTRQLVHLTASTDNLLPTHLGIADEIKEMISVYYDKRKQGDTRYLFQEVKWKDPDDFLRYTNSRNSDNSDVQTVTDPSGIILLILNNRGPTYYTSFDDNALVFDSFDNTVDDTLQTSKTQARAYVTPSFTMSDTFVPDLPEEAFAALVEEVKSRAQHKLHQTADLKSEAEAKKQQSWLSRKSWRVNGGVRYPNYGRNRSRRTIDITFRDEKNGI